MAKPIPLGVRGEADEMVKFEHTLAARHRPAAGVFHAGDDRPYGESSVPCVATLL